MDRCFGRGGFIGKDHLIIAPVAEKRYVLLSWKKVMSGCLIDSQQTHWSADIASVYS